MLCGSSNNISACLITADEKKNSERVFVAFAQNLSLLCFGSIFVERVFVSGAGSRAKFPHKDVFNCNVLLAAFCPDFLQPLFAVNLVSAFQPLVLEANFNLKIDTEKLSAAWFKDYLNQDFPTSYRGTKVKQHCSEL